MRGGPPLVPGTGVAGITPCAPPNALSFRFSLLFMALGWPDGVLALVAKFALALLYMAACSRYFRRRSFTYSRS